MDRQKILVVDDENRMRKLVKDFLQRENFEVLEAGDGSEALDVFFAHQDIALIILDVMMPKMDGYDFLRNLRQMPGGKRPKVVFCTTENDIAHIARAMHAGADEYIMKPFDKEIVASKFHQVGLL